MMTLLSRLMKLHVNLEEQNKTIMQKCEGGRMKSMRQKSVCW